MCIRDSWWIGSNEPPKIPIRIKFAADEGKVDHKPERGLFGKKRKESSMQKVTDQVGVIYLCPNNLSLILATTFCCTTKRDTGDCQNGILAVTIRRLYLQAAQSPKVTKTVCSTPPRNLGNWMTKATGSLRGLCFPVRHVGRTTTVCPKRCKSECKVGCGSRFLWDVATAR